MSFWRYTDEMNCLVIGLGSIGIRHKEVLDQMGMNTFSLSKHYPKSDKNYHNLKEALEKIDPEYVVVANETYLHLETVLELIDLQYKGKLLVEKPLDFKMESLSVSNFITFSVGFNLRFLPLLLKLQEFLNNSGLEIFLVEIYYGNLFSNWRDASRRKNSYSSNTAKGGGVLRDFSHEIDLIFWLFGSPKINFAYGTRLGRETFDSDDIWFISVSTDKVPILSLTLNSLDTNKKREIRLLTSLGTIILDLEHNKFFAEQKQTSFKVSIAETYKLMHGNILLSASPRYATFDDGIRVDNFIYSAENVRIES